MSKIEGKIDYQERVLPGLWFYAATLVMPLSFFLIALPFGEEIALYSGTSSLFLVWLTSWLLAPKIQITDQHLRVGKATIDRDFLGSAQPIPQQESFIARGQELHLNAYAVFQVSVKGLVRVEVRDAEDPTPYWIFSTRNPEIVAAVLNKI